MQQVRQVKRELCYAKRTVWPGPEMTGETGEAETRWAMQADSLAWT